MNTINSIENLFQLHQLIKAELTGSSLDISHKMKVSRRCVQKYINELRIAGAIVGYDNKRKTYYYQNRFEMLFTWKIIAS